MSKLANQWVEIFEAGTYGEKGSYSSADLDKIVASYDPKKHEAPVVIGHPKDNAPAFGWVEGLKREGSKLLAKFRDIVPEFEKAVEQGLFKKRSVSLYGGDAPSLRHVGFLGAMPPHIKGLADIKFEDGDRKEVEIEFSCEESNTMKDFDMKAFSEAVGNAVTSALEKLGLKTPSGEKTFTEKELNDKLAEKDKKIKEFEEKEANSKRDTAVAATIAKLKGAKKWVPAFDAMKVPALFAALFESDVTIEFEDKDKKKTQKSAYELFESFFEGIGEIVPTKEIVDAARGAKRGGKVIKFTEPNDGAEVRGQEIAEYAEKLAREDKTLTPAEAYRRARRELGDDTGGASAGAV